MAVISSSKTLDRLSKKLQRHGLNYWVGMSSGDAWGKYLLFEVGGKCVGGAGWSIREATAYVNHLIRYKDYEERPPFHFGG